MCIEHVRIKWLRACISYCIKNCIVNMQTRLFNSHTLFTFLVISMESSSIEVSVLLSTVHCCPLVVDWLLCSLDRIALREPVSTFLHWERCPWIVVMGWRYLKECIDTLHKLYWHCVGYSTVTSAVDLKPLQVNQMKIDDKLARCKPNISLWNTISSLFNC